MDILRGFASLLITLVLEGINFLFFFQSTHSGILSLRQKKLLGTEVWFPRSLE